MSSSNVKDNSKDESKIKDDLWKDLKDGGYDNADSDVEATEEQVSLIQWSNKLFITIFSLLFLDFLIYLFSFFVVWEKILKASF